MSSCLQDDYISSKTTHPHCRCILRFFSTAQTPQRFGITSPFSSLMRFVTWRGALTWLGARHSISELKSLVVGCMIPTKKMSYILSIRFVSCYLRVFAEIVILPENSWPLKDRNLYHPYYLDGDDVMSFFCVELSG